MTSEGESGLDISLDVLSGGFPEHAMGLEKTVLLVAGSNP
jgi:hypothetical protein